jgi:hypothetical protein
MLPPCEPEGYGFEQTPAVSSSKYPGAVLLTAGWLTADAHGRVCMLQTTVRLKIVSASGAVALRARWHAKTVLGPWSAAVHTWAWRNWCDDGGKPHAEFTDMSGKHARQLIPHPPACTKAGANPTLTSLGDGPDYVPRPDGVITPRFLPKRAPPPSPSSWITVENAMIASDGYTLVAVYAGSPGGDGSRGRFVIVHQNLLFGIDYTPPDVVNLGKVGRLTITKIPRSGPRSAQRGKVGFVAANGTKGFLELRNDRVRIVRRG